MTKGLLDVLELIGRFGVLSLIFVSMGNTNIIFKYGCLLAIVWLLLPMFNSEEKKNEIKNSF